MKTGQNTSFFILIFSHFFLNFLPFFLPEKLITKSLHSSNQNVNCCYILFKNQSYTSFKRSLNRLGEESIQIKPKHLLLVVAHHLFVEMSHSSSPINSDVDSSEDSNSDDDASKYLRSLVDNLGKPNKRMLELLKAKEQNRKAWNNALQGSSTSSNPRRRRRYVDRGRAEGARRLYRDYFSENPVYHGDFFRRRFRMRRSLFDRIHNAVASHDNYFEQKRDCTGQLGLSPLQKMTAALRMLAYGCCADQCDEYLRIGETTALECMRRFSAAVIQCFGKEYLREPTSADMKRLLAENEKRGFPGMLGSLDCMHWNWKNCPAAWRGSYKNYKGYTSIVLEGIADHTGWFWHAFFGMPGTFNDVNVMNTSSVFDRMMAGNIPSIEPYTVNGNTYRHYYYLGDGIYPKYSTIMKTVRDPRGDKEKRFAAFQEGCRKDIERAFGMLQARWGVIKRPAMGWSKEAVSDIMIACIILHNMITEDEQHVPPCDYLVLKKDQEVLKERRKTKEEQEAKMTKRKVMEGRYKEMVDGYAQLRSTAMHERLKNDLVEHIWRQSILGNIHCG